jgi:hypothetical protein
VTKPVQVKWVVQSPPFCSPGVGYIVMLPEPIVLGSVDVHTPWKATNWMWWPRPPLDHLPVLFAPGVIDCTSVAVAAFCPSELSYKLQLQ